LTIYINKYNIFLTHAVAQVPKHVRALLGKWSTMTTTAVNEVLLTREQYLELLAAPVHAERYLLLRFECGTEHEETLSFVRMLYRYT